MAGDSLVVNQGEWGHDAIQGSEAAEDYHREHVVCLLSSNVSTANTRRIKSWEEKFGPVLVGNVIAARCGNPYCHSPACLFQRPKMDTRIAARVWAFALPTLLALPPGGNIGLKPPVGHSSDKSAGQLRQLLSRSDVTSRWSVRVRTDGVWVINRIGQWDSFYRNTTYERYETFVPKPRIRPVQCACGCGQPSTEGAFVAGHRERAQRMKVCAGCGASFEGPNRYCSS